MVAGRLAHLHGRSIRDNLACESAGFSKSTLSAEITNGGYLIVVVVWIERFEIGIYSTSWSRGMQHVVRRASLRA